MSPFKTGSSPTAAVQRLRGSHKLMMDPSFFLTLWNEADGSAHILHRAATFAVLRHQESGFQETIAH